MLCDPTVSVSEDDLTMEEYFIDKGIFVNYTDNNFDFDDYYNPIQASSYMDSMWLDPNTSKYLNIFIKKTDYYDDFNPFFSDPQLTETFERDYSNIDFSKAVMVNRSSAAMAEIFFWSSNTIQQYKRSYQKIDKVLGSLAGVFNLLFFSVF